MARTRFPSIALPCLLLAMPAVAQEQSYEERALERSRQIDAEIEAEAFVGITTDGTVRPGLFELRSTGVSTGPVREAADAFLASLDDAQRAKTTFPADDIEWRKWLNPHFYVRQGMGFEEMSKAQREAAFGLMRASLSAKGFELSRDIMRLNHTLGELDPEKVEQYGEWLYWISVMGEPSETEPWGWQLDGHHLILNYFVLGDQVVMTPSFFGSEPVTATSGRYEGTTILRDEQGAGLAMLRALTPEQKALAVLSETKEGRNNQAEARRDNLVLDYAGVPVAGFDPAQRARLRELIGLYTGNFSESHAAVWLDEVAAHFDETWFAWVGGDADDSVYYYRIHSPVILIEFDHQPPANLRHINPPGVPNREHSHTVIRTPNGNDYGKDLLRQHYETTDHHQAK